MDNVMSDDLPINTGPGREQLYLVSGSVIDAQGRAVYWLIVRARSNWDAGEQFGRWARQTLGGPVVMLLTIGAERAHAESMETLDEPSRREPGRRARLLAQDELFSRGVGSYLCRARDDA